MLQMFVLLVHKMQMIPRKFYKVGRGQQCRTWREIIDKNLVIKDEIIDNCKFQSEYPVTFLGDTKMRRSQLKMIGSGLNDRMVAIGPGATIYDSIIFDSSVVIFMSGESEMMLDADFEMAKDGAKQFVDEVPNYYQHAKDNQSQTTISRNIVHDEFAAANVAKNIDDMDNDDRE